MSYGFNILKTRVRFNSDDDLCLLREVVQENTLKYPEKWNIVQANMRFNVGKEFSIRTLKDHLMILLKKGIRKSISNKLNIAQEFYSEKDLLLQKISDMCKELAPTMAKRNKAVPKELQIASLGMQASEYSAVKEDNNEGNIPVQNIIITLKDHSYCDHLSTESDFVEEIVIQAENPAEVNNFSEVTRDEPNQRKCKNSTEEIKLRNIQDLKGKKDIEEDRVQYRTLRNSRFSRNKSQKDKGIEDGKPEPNHPPPLRTRCSSHEESRHNSSSDEVLDTAIHCVPSKKSKQPQLDGVDHLFLSYAATFKTFRPMTQAKMKLKLASIFAETELSELQGLNK